MDVEGEGEHEAASDGEVRAAGRERGAAGAAEAAEAAEAVEAVEASVACVAACSLLRAGGGAWAAYEIAREALVGGWPASALAVLTALLRRGGLGWRPEAWLEGLQLLAAAEAEAQQGGVAACGRVHARLCLAARSLETACAPYLGRANVCVVPCVSPWGYEHVERWNPQCKDPNRSFKKDAQTEESAALMAFLATLEGTWAAHCDLHETTDTDETEFMPARAAEGRWSRRSASPKARETPLAAGRPPHTFAGSPDHAHLRIGHLRPRASTRSRWRSAPGRNPGARSTVGSGPGAMGSGARASTSSGSAAPERSFLYVRRPPPTRIGALSGGRGRGGIARCDADRR